MRRCELGRGGGCELGFGMRVVHHLWLRFIGVYVWHACRIIGSSVAARILTQDRVPVGHVARRETTNVRVPPVSETRVLGLDVRQREVELSYHAGAARPGGVKLGRHQGGEREGSKRPRGRKARAGHLGRGPKRRGI